jgi:hypothetical protein
MLQALAVVVVRKMVVMPAAQNPVAVVAEERASVMAALVLRQRQDRA